MKKLFILTVCLMSGIACAMDDLPSDASVQEALEYGLVPTLPEQQRNTAIDEGQSESARDSESRTAQVPLTLPELQRRIEETSRQVREITRRNQIALQGRTASVSRGGIAKPPRLIGPNRTTRRRPINQRARITSIAMPLFQDNDAPSARRLFN